MPSAEDLSLAEQRFEALDDLVREFANPLNSRAAYKVFPEGYIEGKVALYLYMGIRAGRSNREPQYWLAVIQRLLEGHFDLADHLEVMRNEPKCIDYLLADGQYRRHNDAVFIGIGETGEHGEGMIRPLRNLIRLYPLDLAEEDGIEIFGHGRPAFARPPIPAGVKSEDRKLLLAHRPLAGNDHLADQMVEGGTEILNRVTEDQSEPQEVERAGMRSQDILRALRLNLTPEWPWLTLDRSADLVFEGLEMFVCPVELPPDTVQ